MDASRIAREATRLRPLVDRVLTHYAMNAREVTHLATHSNVMFRVVSGKGHQFVLRVGTPHSNTRSNIDIEVAWLDALIRETPLFVVEPIHTVEGGLVVDEMDPELGKERPCVLFSWIPGSAMGDGAGPFGYRLLGQMSASLQEHGRSWDPPEVERARAWDQIFYYDRDFDPVVIGDPVYEHLFDRPRQRIIVQAGYLAREVISESWDEDRAQVVHGDLHEWNVHISGSTLHAFDFEDVMYAMPAQDVAISLYHTRTSDQRDEIRDAFRKGYESVLPWPVVDDEQMDGLHAARQIMLMNYAARALPVKEAEEYLDRVVPWLEGYVRRYQGPS